MQIYKAGVADYKAHKLTSVRRAQLCQPVCIVSSVRFFL